VSAVRSTSGMDGGALLAGAGSAARIEPAQQGARTQGRSESAVFMGEE